ncbi:MAG: Ig-like domain-containing protein [Candidatus Dormibacteraeota bacterium]|nr:Ig-like domain-containing protein [Candidatus Dormibacteraeota bacterium]
MMNDPELEELFQDPAHREVVDLLKMSRPAAPPLDADFRNYLRAKLMTEARRTLQPMASRRRFPFSLSPRVLAPAMAAVAAGFLVVLGIQIYLQNQAPSSMVAVDLSRIQNKTNVATAAPIVIPFTGPIDKNAIAATVVIEPATSVTKQWVGQNLVIIPDHPLAPNTTYTVSLKASAAPKEPNPSVQATPTVAPSPVVVHFTTVRAPAPQAGPPSYRSANVSYGPESRLADAGTVFSASWTPTGQLLVARPAGQPGLASSPTASATTSVSAAATPTTDVWLLSASGTPIRVLVPGGSFPAAAASGGLLAAWQVTSGKGANLVISDLQGNIQGPIATLDGLPDRAPVWIGSDRIAYLNQGRLLIVDPHGAHVNTPAAQVQHGSLAGSPLGTLLAVESADESTVIDLASASPSPLPAGATGFAWSSKGDLAFVVPQPSGSVLYTAAGGKNARRVASSPSGQIWSDLNWAPDGASLMLASKPVGASASSSRLKLINADGSGLTRSFASDKEASSPQWSSHGDLVLFTRQDEAGGRAFWTANTAPSEADAAANQALAEVDRFMQARLRADSAAAQDDLDAAGLSAYQGGASSLLSPAGTKFERYYPVTVQQTGSNPNKFLVGVRIFVSRSGVQRSFFEEQLTLILKDQRYLVDAVTSTPAVSLGHGPTVLSYDVVPAPSGYQVRVRFDADLRPETVTRETIQVKDADGKLVNAQIAFDPDSHTATLGLTLRPGSTYQLVVTTGVTDVNGVTMADEYHAQVIGR